ncbi:hypothetical protein ABZ929_02285 [Streptomyces physcomitrii]|uniref:hypothetical protein n=1 Tax=Streptomyces physcomitrii TaxID=2724184 RepID=UPI0033F8E473
MADEQYEWLSPEAVERLLCGEALGNVDDHARAQAERLARTLSALTPADLGAGGELPGEEAALAAFREARQAPVARGAAIAHGAAASTVHHGHGSTTTLLAPREVLNGRRGGGAGAVRIGRPMRWGMAAAVAACMIGGVAVAGSAGVLPSPFKDPRPSPASTVSPEPDQEVPLSSEFPAVPDSEESESGSSPTPEDTPRRNTGNEPESGDAEARGGKTPVPSRPVPERDRPGHPDSGAKEWWQRAVQACRAYEAGTLDAEKQQALEEAAKGAGRLKRYCEKVLDAEEGHGGSQDGHDGDWPRPGGGRPDQGSGHDDDSGQGPVPDPSKASTLPAPLPPTTLPAGDTTSSAPETSGSPLSLAG